MNTNLYWPVYKNIEREVVKLSFDVHFDDKQIDLYSIKIVDLLIRTAVEVESLAKNLYFANGGTKEDNNELFFDTDCIAFLEDKWSLSQKKVLVSSPNFFFEKDENLILTPLKKSARRGSSSSDWLKAYQAVKHNRVTSLHKGSLKHLIRGLGALYLLNIYLQDRHFYLGKANSVSSIDPNLGSDIFSIKVHANTGVNTVSTFIKNPDYNECVYIITHGNGSEEAVQKAWKAIDDEKFRVATSELNLKLKAGGNMGRDEITELFKDSSHMVKAIQQQPGLSKDLRDACMSATYEGVLNKNQF